MLIFRIVRLYYNYILVQVITSYDVFQSITLFITFVKIYSTYEIMIHVRKYLIKNNIK